MDISNHDENDNQNLTATTSVDNNATHLDALPQSNSDMMDVSQAPNSGDNPNKHPSKETAQALRAKKNLAVQNKHTLRNKRTLPRGHGVIRRPLYSSSDSDSDGPDSIQSGATTNKGNEGRSHSDTRFHHSNENSHEESGGDDTRPPTSKETTHLSGARNSNPSSKRHHSSSAIHLKKLGSMENPIDVDSIASLFEPVAIKEYV